MLKGLAFADLGPGSEKTERPGKKAAPAKDVLRRNPLRCISGKFDL
jgi:hypothetical protein